MYVLGICTLHMKSLCLMHSLNHSFVYADAKEQGLAPHALTRLLEVPSVPLEEDIRLEHDAVWNMQSRLKPSVETIADDSHFTEEDPSVTWTLNSTSLESRGRVRPRPSVD